MIITAKYDSNHFIGYGESAIEPFSHYKSMEVSVAMATKLRDRLPQLIYFELPLPKQHLYQIRVLLLQWF